LFKIKKKQKKRGGCFGRKKMSDTAAQIFYNASKKDDEARLISSNNELFVETTAQLDGFVPIEDDQPIEESSLLEDAAVDALPDIRIQSIRNMFIAHIIAILVCITLGLPFYYWPLSHTTLVVSICVACAVQTVVYIIMVFLRKTHPQLALVFYAVWVIASACVLGKFITFWVRGF